MTLKSLVKSMVLSASAVLLTNAAQAQWSLDNDSSTLSFVTVKADHVGEVHTFDHLTGTIEDDGAVVITIELASVNTMIDIRNERMQAMLFEKSYDDAFSHTESIFNMNKKKQKLQEHFSKLNE